MRKKNFGRKKMLKKTIFLSENLNFELSGILLSSKMRVLTLLNIILNDYC